MSSQSMSEKNFQVFIVKKMLHCGHRKSFAVIFQNSRNFAIAKEEHFSQYHILFSGVDTMEFTKLRD